jgi:hypothetical protein
MPNGTENTRREARDLRQLAFSRLPAGSISIALPF